MNRANKHMHGIKAGYRPTVFLHCQITFENPLAQKMRLSLITIVTALTASVSVSACISEGQSCKFYECCLPMICGKYFGGTHDVCIYPLED